MGKSQSKGIKKEELKSGDQNNADNKTRQKIKHLGK